MNRLDLHFLTNETHVIFMKQEAFAADGVMTHLSVSESYFY